MDAPAIGELGSVVDMNAEDAAKIAEEFARGESRTFSRIGCVNRIALEKLRQVDQAAQADLWSIEFIIPGLERMTPGGFFVLVDDGTREARFAR
jgi:hypothetical protein